MGFYQPSDNAEGMIIFATEREKFLTEPCWSSAAGLGLCCPLLAWMETDIGIIEYYCKIYGILNKAVLNLQYHK